MERPPQRGSFRALVVEPFRADLAAWQRHGFATRGVGALGVALLLVRYPGVRATLLHRIGHWASVRHVPGLATVCAQLNVTLHALEMVPSVPVGAGLYMPHTVGSVINAVSIGSDVTLQGGITVGLRVEPRFPRIESGVTLAAGCRVLGAVTVGAGATVGANAVVMHDVAPGDTVVGVPARSIGSSAAHPGEPHPPAEERAGG